MDVKELVNALKDFENEVDCDNYDCDKCPIGDKICDKLYFTGKDLLQREAELKPKKKSSDNPELLDLFEKISRFTSMSCTGINCTDCLLEGSCIDLMRIQSKICEKRDSRNE